MTIEYLKCRADLNFDVSFGTIVNWWDHSHQYHIFSNQINMPLIQEHDCPKLAINNDNIILENLCKTSATFTDNHSEMDEFIYGIRHVYSVLSKQ